MLIRREPGELFALRHTMPTGGDPLAGEVEAWVERLDPRTLAVLASSPRLPSGRFWPGGIAAHANGEIHMVFGNSAHRLTSDLRRLKSRRLPVDRPYNSFVLLDGGELVSKDCDAPAGTAPVDGLGARPGEPRVAGSGARTPRTEHRPAFVRRRERHRGRYRDRLPAALRPRRRSARDRRHLEAPLRTGTGADLRLGSR